MTLPAAGARGIGAVSALARGLGRAFGASRLLLWLWLANFAAALPLAVVVAEAIRSDLGASLVHRDLERTFDLAWHGEFEARASGAAASLSPSVSGPGAALDTFEAWLSGEMFLADRALVTAGVIYALLGCLLMGGVLRRLAHPGAPTALGPFLADGGAYFFRFARLAAFSAPLYYGIYRLGRRLFPWIEEAMRDVTSERAVLGVNLTAALVLGILLLTVRTVFDYARVATVLEERRSVFAALWRSLRFVASRPLSVSGIVAGAGLALASLTVAYALLAPGAGALTWVQVILVFAGGQLYLLGKLFLRLVLSGGEVALFEFESIRAD